MSYNPYYAQSAPAPAPWPAPSEPMKALRASFGSGLYLLAVISYSIYVLTMLLLVFTPDNSAVQLIFRLLQQFGPSLPYALSAGEIYQYIAPIQRSVSLFAMVPAAVMLIGLWLSYGAARQDKPHSSTAGFTMLQVMAILGLASYALSAITMLTLIFPAIALSSYVDSLANWQGLGVGMVILAFIFWGVILAFSIIYFIKLFNIYDGAKALCNGRNPKKPASAFVIVINLLGVLLNIAYVVGIIYVRSTFRLPLSYPALLTIINTVIAIAYNVFLSITFMELRAREKALPPQAPPAPQNFHPYQPYGERPYAQQPPYGAPQPGFAPQPPYGAPQQGFAPQPPYGAPQQGFAPQPPYGAPQPGFAPQPPYQAPQQGFAPQSPYGAPQPSAAPQPEFVPQSQPAEPPVTETSAEPAPEEAAPEEAAPVPPVEE